MIGGSLEIIMEGVRYVCNTNCEAVSVSDGYNNMEYMCVYNCGGVMVKFNALNLKYNISTMVSTISVVFSDIFDGLGQDR